MDTVWYYGGVIAPRPGRCRGPGTKSLPCSQTTHAHNYRWRSFHGQQLTVNTSFIICGTNCVFTKLYLYLLLAMGSRARKKWQGDLLSTLPTHESDEDDDSAEDEEEEVAATVAAPKAAFALMMDSDDEDDEEESSSEEKSVQSDDRQVASRALAENKEKNEAAPASGNDNNTAKEQEPEEDLDAILDEFQLTDSMENANIDQSSTLSSRTSEFAPILRNVDVRDLDIDKSLRNALHGTEAATPSGRSRTRTVSQLFGTHPSNTPRPPHFVGGGMGMVSYDRLDDRSAPAAIPWPYDEQTSFPQQDTKPSAYTYADSSRWYTFQYSDTYARELADYRQIEQSGDVNALLLFAAHHPYCTAALMQLVSVLNQTNHANEAQQLLKRCLWVYECAALQGFHKDLLYTGRHALMDGQRHENRVFFEALWELVRRSITTGLHKSAWTIGRYLWGLDPWRDPMGVLLVLDSFAMNCQTDEADRWIIQVVEDKYTNQIWYHEDGFNFTHLGELQGIPNWAFSYALALFRVHGNDPQTANPAIQRALRGFPGVIGQMLQKLEVDTTGRSFRRDWSKVLDKATQRSKDLHHAYLAEDDAITSTAALQAVDFIVKVFLERLPGAWGNDDVLQWLYDNLCTVLEEPLKLPPLCTAMMKYTRFKASHFETRVQQLPADANIIDPGLLAHAMVIDSNRPRLLRRQQQRQQEEAAQAFAAAHPQGHVIGGPPTGIVDPDWPIAEVFWRSLLPWNHVEGVPPPRR